MTSSFQFFSHFIIEDEISLLNQNIQNLSQFIFSDDKLSLLFFFILILHNDWFFFHLFFIVVEGCPIESQLLVVDDHITLDNFFFELLNFFLVHRLNFVVSFQV